MQEGRPPPNPESLIQTLIDGLLDEGPRRVRQRLGAALCNSPKAPAPRQPPIVLKRPLGWAADLVLKVLSDAKEPMRPRQIVAEIRSRFDEPIARATVLHTLRQGKHARAGKLCGNGPGLYESGRTEPA